MKSVDKYIEELETERLSLIQDIFILTRNDIEFGLYAKVKMKWRKKWNDIEIRLQKTN